MSLESAEEHFVRTIRECFTNQLPWIGIDNVSLTSRQLWKNAMEAAYPGIQFKSLKGSCIRQSSVILGITSTTTPFKHCRYEGQLSTSKVIFHCLLVEPEQGTGMAPGIYVTKYTIEEGAIPPPAEPVLPTANGHPSQATLYLGLTTPVSSVLSPETVAPEPSSSASDIDSARETHERTVKPRIEVCTAQQQLALLTIHEAEDSRTGGTKLPRSSSACWTATTVATEPGHCAHCGQWMPRAPTPLQLPEHLEAFSPTAFLEEDWGTPTALLLATEPFFEPIETIEPHTPTFPATVAAVEPTRGALEEWRAT